MFILSFIPDFLVHLALVIGILALLASWVATFVQFVSQYRLPIQVAGIVLTVFAVYLEGGIANEQVWRQRVLEMEAKVAKAEAASAVANTELTEAISKRREAIREAVSVARSDIAKNSAEINRECKLSPISVDLYNRAVRGGK